MMTPLDLLPLSTPTSGSIGTPYHDIGPRERSPRLALVAGVHGNELNGIFILARLADFLKRIHAGERRQQRLRERVLIIPAANPMAVNTYSRLWPFDRVDINRVFPGREDGEIGERIAAAVLQTTRQAYYRVDIHSSNTDIEEMPQVRLYEPNDDERATACLFGLPAVIEQPVNPIFTTHLVHAWRKWGGENFVIQSGMAGSLQTSHCEVLFRALVSFLDRTGIVEGLVLSEEEENLRYFGLNQSFALLADHAGLFVTRLEVGRWIQAGSVVGHIYDAFTGEIRSEVQAPVSGLVSSMRRQPLLTEGDLMIRILTTAPVGDHVFH